MRSPDKLHNSNVTVAVDECRGGAVVGEVTERDEL